MLGDTEEANRRRPFEFLSNIFKRRKEHEEVGSDIKPPEIRFEGRSIKDKRGFTRGFFLVQKRLLLKTKKYFFCYGVKLYDYFSVY